MMMRGATARDMVEAGCANDCSQANCMIRRMEWEYGFHVRSVVMPEERRRTDKGRRASTYFLVGKDRFHGPGKVFPSRRWIEAAEAVEREWGA